MTGQEGKGRSTKSTDPESASINFVFNVSAKDAESFRESQSQIEADMSSAVRAARRGI
jgi:hypothetical protein